MSRTMLSFVLVGLVVLGLLGLGFTQLFERQWTTEATPPTGEASYNRFYALQHVLRNMGFRSNSRLSLTRALPVLQPGDTVVIADDISRISVEQSAQLVAWVARGGHLLFSPTTDAPAQTPLLQRLNLLEHRAPMRRCTMLSTQSSAGVIDTDHRLQLCGATFWLNRDASYFRARIMIGDDAQGLAFARLYEGAGDINLLNDFEPLSNAGLRQAPAQQFVRRVLEPNSRRGTFYFIDELGGASFWMNLLLNDWPALLALGLLLLAWAVMRSERLGPIIPAPAVHRRALLEHIQGAGEFFFRRDGGRSLHRLACVATMARLRRRDPATADLSDEDLYDWLAQRSQLDPAHIAQAFRSPANAAAFRECMTTLARLRTSL